MASKYETSKKWNASPFDVDPLGSPGEIGLGGAVLVKVPKWRTEGEWSHSDLHWKDGNVFDTSGMGPNEWEETIWKKWNMHRDPKKSHRDTYIPPDYAPDLAYEDNRPIKGMKEDDFKNL